MFEYRQAEEVRDAFAAAGVRYLFLGKSGAIILGYPDTTQDADVYVEKSVENGIALVAALGRLGFALTGEEQEQVRHACPSGHNRTFSRSHRGFLYPR